METRRTMLSNRMRSTHVSSNSNLRRHKGLSDCSLPITHVDDLMLLVDPELEQAVKEEI